MTKPQGYRYFTFMAVFVIYQASGLSIYFKVMPVSAMYFKSMAAFAIKQRLMTTAVSAIHQRFRIIRTINLWLFYNNNAPELKVL